MKFITWGQELGIKECPYLKRWVLNFGWFSLRVHHWLASDDQRHYHNHAWWFITWVIKGHYVDIADVGIIPDSLTAIDVMTTGKIRFRPADHSHKVDVLRPTWTFLITGPVKQPWGFFVNGKFKKANKYFFEQGHHPCSEGQPPVRTPTPERKS